MLKENLEEVEEKIAKACERAGRAREEVTLIAVSKTKPVEMLQEMCIRDSVRTVPLCNNGCKFGNTL